MRRTLSALAVVATLLLDDGGASAGSGGAGGGVAPAIPQNGVGQALNAICANLGMTPGVSTACPKNVEMFGDNLSPLIADIAALRG
jgi:hypothetical protein